MKTTLWILLAVFIIINSAEPNIKFKPFSISFGNVYEPFAIIFLSMSIIFFKLSAKRDYYNKGFKEGCDFVIDELNQKLKTKDADCEKSIK